MILHLNEAIKQIGDLSYDIRIRSLNALILSIQMGKAAAGFGIVTGELINFSSEIERKNQTLESLNSDVVRQTSALIQIARRHSLLQSAVAKIPPGSAGASRDWSPTLQKCRQEEELRQSNIQTMIKRLIRLVAEAREVCRMARVTLMSGKIESAYLKELSENFTHTISRIEESVATMEVVVEDIKSTWN